MPPPPGARRCARRLLFRAGGLLVLAVAAGLAGAEDSLPPAATPEIEYGYPDQSIFIATKDSQGRTDSPMIHLAAALLNRAGLRWHAVGYPAARLFRNLQDGNTNFSILVRSSALESCCLLSKAPVYGTQLNVYSLGDTPPARSREDLIGKNVITVSGYTYAGLLAFINDPANRIRNEAAATHKAAFEMLAARRADYVLDYASAADDLLGGHRPPGLRFGTLDRVDIFLVLSKSYPDAERTMAHLEAIARTLRMDEVLKGRDNR